LTKTIIGGSNPPLPRMSSKRAFFFSSLLIISTRWSTVSTAWPATPIVTIAGRRRYFFVRRSTGGGIVAENMTCQARR
jgi:hypothetical protein